MPSWKKCQQVSQMIQACRQLSLAGLRNRYPQATEDELRKRLAALWLERQVVMKVMVGIRKKKACEEIGCMKEKAQEWLKQADYDLDTAQYMFDGGRYFYVVFMCHLSIEKALKGLFFAKKGQIPPKIHSLIYFIEQLQLEPPPGIGRFMVKLNESSVTTRYPENLEKISQDYTKPVVAAIIENSREVLRWIKKQF